MKSFLAIRSNVLRRMSNCISLVFDAELVERLVDREQRACLDGMKQGNPKLSLRTISFDIVLVGCADLRTENVNALVAKSLNAVEEEFLPRDLSTAQFHRAIVDSRTQIVILAKPDDARMERQCVFSDYTMETSLLWPGTKRV